MRSDNCWTNRSETRGAVHFGILAITLAVRSLAFLCEHDTGFFNHREHRDHRVSSMLGGVFESTEIDTPVMAKNLLRSWRRANQSKPAQRLRCAVRTLLIDCCLGIRTDIRGGGRKLRHFEGHHSPHSKAIFRLRAWL